MPLYAPVVGTTVYTGAVTSTSLTPPAGVRADDIVLAVIAQKPSVALGGSITPPAGWSLVYQVPASADTSGWGTILGADTGAMTLAVFRWNTPVAGSTTPVVFTLTQANSQWGHILRIPTALSGTAQRLTRRTIVATETAAPVDNMLAGANFSFQWSTLGLTQDPLLAYDNPSGGTSSRAGDLLYWAFAIPTDAQTPNQFTQVLAQGEWSYYDNPIELNEPDTSQGNDSGGFTAYTFCTSGRETHGYPEEYYFLNQFTPAGTQAILNNTAGPAILVRVREELAPVDNKPNNQFFTPILTGHPLIVKVGQEGGGWGGGPFDEAVSGDNYVSANAQISAHDIGVLIVQFKSLPGLTGGYLHDSDFWGSTPALVASGGGYGGTIDDNNGDSTVHIYTIRPSSEVISYGAVSFDANVQVGWARVYVLPYRGGLVGGVPLPMSVAVGYGARNSAVGDDSQYTVSLTTSAPGQTSLFQDGDSVIFGMSATSDLAEYADNSFALSAQGASFGPFEADYDVTADYTTAKILGKYVATKVQKGSYALSSAAVEFSARSTANGQYHRGPVFFIRIRTAGADVGQIRSPERVNPLAQQFFAPTISGGIVAPAQAGPVVGPVATVTPGFPYNVYPQYPTGAIVANKGALVLFVAFKNSSSFAPTVDPGPGWTLRASISGGGYASYEYLRDRGNSDVYCFTKDAITGTESGALDVLVFTASSIWAQIAYVPAPATVANISFASTTAIQNDTPRNASISLPFSSNPGFVRGDIAMLAMSIATDDQTPSQFSDHSITATGASFSAAVELSEPEGAGGSQQIGGVFAWARVDSGSATAPPVFNATVLTSSVNVRGPALLLRIRQSNVLFPFLVPTAPAFFTPTINQTLNITLVVTTLVNTSVIYITTSVARPALLANSSVLYAPSYFVGARPQLLQNLSALFSPLVELETHVITKAQALQLMQIHFLHGLGSNPLVVTGVARTAGAITQSVSQVGSTVTVSTTAAPTSFVGNPGLMINELAALHGLTADLVVTPTTRSAGSVSQTMTNDGTTTTVTRV